VRSEVVAISPKVFNFSSCILPDKDQFTERYSSMNFRMCIANFCGFRADFFIIINYVFGLYLPKILSFKLSLLPGQVKRLLNKKSPYFKYLQFRQLDPFLVSNWKPLPRTYGLAPIRYGLPIGPNFRPDCKFIIAAHFDCRFSDIQIPDTSFLAELLLIIWKDDLLLLHFFSTA